MNKTCWIQTHAHQLRSFADLVPVPFSRIAGRMYQFATCAALALIAISPVARAADWSDTYLGYRYGTQFREPFNKNDISKNIINVGHASGYKYGSQWFNADFLISDNKDPAGAGSTNGAHQVYFKYRNTLDLEKTTGNAFKFGVVKGVGLTVGLDFDAKNDAGYNSKKRQLALGPTVSFDVPGFLTVGLVQLWESNAPYNTFTKVSTPRYSYKPHPSLQASWNLPIGSDTGFSLEGYGNLTAAKGKDEFGAQTATEINIDTQVMYDLGRLYGSKGGPKLGLQYQYWRNKFGADHNGAAGSGAIAKTPMIRFQYHF